MESVGGDERDQAGAEAALLLRTQSDVLSHAVTQLTEGETQQPASTLPQFYLFVSHCDGNSDNLASAHQQYHFRAFVGQKISAVNFHFG